MGLPLILIFIALTGGLLFYRLWQGRHLTVTVRTATGERIVVSGRKNSPEFNRELNRAMGIDHLLTTPTGTMAPRQQMKSDYLRRNSQGTGDTMKQRKYPNDAQRDYRPYPPETPREPVRKSALERVKEGFLDDEPDDRDCDESR